MTSMVVREILRETRERLSAHPPTADRVKVNDARNLPARAADLRSRGISPIIAEIKPRILGRSLLPDEVAAMARRYEADGACTISVLTQPTYFLGSPENAKSAREASSLPILRKDFILEERQLDEVASDLVLLIAAFSPHLDGLVEAAESRGMEPLVEVHTEEELTAALKTGTRMVGINNRNLSTLEVSLDTFKRLGPVAKGSGLFVVAESGIETREDVLRMEEAGADALLVGTSLMQEPALLPLLNGAARP
ncbi:indole-3-glycerol-phosphate synthase [Candidatus Methanocrinis natronophilus]|uniref:indole-3-glycerol-phosphate synthase n=1 Tax=Candidatus Methanocrinis natronophilus TaxID=3033396 RepID=A0ABT5X8Z1_9EURY|nr:indole-3-glycerol-phosphate synthase [Candidatus Methanocrinis natronophilus]MDF0591146.1 indole-3-glycerol-phosphate synthase [Candidatus Methanocrinis natronophilus]